MPTTTNKLLASVTAIAVALQPMSVGMAGTQDYFRPAAGKGGGSSSSSPVGSPSAGTDTQPAQGNGDLALYAARNARARPGLALRFPVTPTNAYGTVTWSVVQGALPDGITLRPDGAVAGTTSAVGTYPGIVVQAVDENGKTGQTQPFTIDVVALPTVSANSASIASGGSLALAPAVANALGSQSWSVTGGALPYGLSLDAATGRISGSSDQSGTYDGLRLVVVDADGALGRSGAFSIAVTSSMSVTGLQPAYAARLNVPFPGLQPTLNGATEAVTWSLLGGRLPAGLSFDPASGAVTGTPTAPVSTGDLHLRATTASGATVSSAGFSITVGTKPVVSVAQSSYFARTGTQFSLVPQALGLVGKGRWFLDGGAVPAGLALSTDAGTLSGTMALTGTAPGLSLRVVDLYDGSSGFSAPFSVQGLGKPAVAGATSSTAVLGYPFTLAPVGSNVLGTASWSLSGTLPAGLAFDPSTGTVSGTPTALTASPASLAVTLVDSYDGSSSGPVAFTLSVQPKGTIVLGGISGPYTAFAGRQFSLAPTIAGADGAASWTLSSLPSWVSFNTSTGRISGTPSAPEPSGALQLSVTDAAGKSASSPTFTLDAVRPLSLAYGPASANQGSAIAITPSVSDASGTVRFSLSGTLPDGVTLDRSTGTLGGTTFVTGTYPLAVTASDDRATSDAVPVNLQVTASPWQASMPAQPGGAVGKPFSAVPSASGFAGPLAWSFPAGATVSGSAMPPLPSWASVAASTGAVTGTPPAAGSWGPYVLEVSDGSGARARTNAFTLSAVVAPVLSASASPPQGYVNAAFRMAASASGSQGATTWSLTSGTLPRGLALDPASGVVSGAPAVTGTSSGLVLTVADGTGSQASTAPFAIAVAQSPLSVGSVADVSGTIGRRVATLAPNVTGASGAYAFSVASGTLPSWASLDPATGIVSGIPTGGDSVGTTPGIVLQVTDASGYARSTNAFALAVSRAALSATSPGYVSHRSVAAAGGRPTVSGALGNLRWAVAPALPDGLSLDPATGAISGTPTGPASAGSFSLTVTDAFDSATASAPASVTVLGTPAVSVASSYQARQGYPFSVQASVSSAMAPVTWSLAAGTLPAGITLDATTGTLRGNPSTTGTVTGLALTAVDAQGAPGTSPAFSIVVADHLSLSFRNGSYAARVGLGFGTDAPVPVGAVGKVTYALGSGTLPAGLSVDAPTGAILGTPSSPGSSAVTVAATDGTGSTQQSPAITIAVDPSPVVTMADATVRVGAPVTTAPSAQYAYARQGRPVSYSFAGLPPGVSFDPAKAAFTGAPTVTGSYPVTVTVTDGDGATGTTGSTLTVTPGLTVSNVAANYLGRVGHALSPTVQPQPGNVRGTLAWTASGLPAGLSVDGGTGIVSGTPTVASAGNATLTAVDGSDKASLSVPVRLTVSPVLTVGGSGFRTHVGMAAATPAPSVVGQQGASLAWSSSGTALPSWAALDQATGIVSTTSAQKPSVAGAALSARDSGDGATATGPAFALEVLDAPTVSGVPTSYVARYGSAFATSAPTLSNAIGTVTWSLGSGTLPGWASLDPATGRIVSPSASALGTTPNLTLVGTDATGASDKSVAFSLGVYSQPAVSLGPVTERVRVGDAYRVTPAAQGVAGTAAWGLVLADGSAALPSGLSMADASTGVVSGTVGSAGTATYTLQVRDSADGTTASSVPVTVRASTALSLGPVADVSVHANAQFVRTTTPAPSGLVGTPSYALDKDVPPGMNPFDASTGVLSGLPSQAYGPTAYVLTVRDGYDGRTASTGFRVTVVGDLAFATQPPGISTSVQSPASSTVSVRNAAGAVSYALMSGSTDVSSTFAPTCPGLSFDAPSGTVSGTPTGECSLSGLTLVATDATGATATSAPFSVAVYSPTATTNPATASIQEGLFATVQASTNLPNPTWSLTNAPAGSSVSTAGLVSLYGDDVPSDASSTVTVTATQGAATASTKLPLTVTAASATLTVPARLRSGQAWSGTASTGMTAGGSWSGTGLAFATATEASTSVSGTAPTVAGPSTSTATPSATFTASGAPAGATPGKALGNATVTVYPALAFTAAAANLSAVPGTPVSWSAPNLQGTVASAATYALYSGQSDVTAAFNASSSPTCPGLSFSTVTGAVSGTPTGDCSIPQASLVAADAGDGAAVAAATAQSRAFSVSVASSFAVATQPGSFSLRQGATQTTQATLSGNPYGTVTGVLVDGSGTTAPSWLAAACSGTTCTVTASPTASVASATYPSTGGYTLVLTDAAGTVARSTAAFTVSVTQGAVSASVATTSYSTVVGLSTKTGPVTASGGSGSYAYTLQTVSGTAPSTVGAFGSDGSFSFTYSTAPSGSWVYQVKVASSTDAANTNTTAQVTVTASAATASVKTAPPSNVLEGNLWSAVVTTNIPSPTWTLVGAPTWLTVDPAGNVTGYAPDVVPVNQQWNFTAKATNGSVSSSTGTINATVNMGTVSIQSTPQTYLRAGQSMSVNVSTTVGAPVTYFGYTYYNGGTGSGTRVDDVTVAFSGNVATLTAAQTVGTGNIARAIYVSATSQNVPTGSGNANAVAGASAGGFNVYPVLTVSGIPSNVTVSKGVSYTGTLTAASLQRTATWTASGTLPAGLTPTVSGNTYTIKGTPTGTAGGTYTVTVTDSLDNSTASQTITFAGASALTATAPASTGNLRQTSYYAFAAPKASGGTGPYTWALSPASASAIPSSMTLDASTGILSGRVAASSGSYNFILRATDSSGVQGDTAAFSLNTTTNNLAVSTPANGGSYGFHVGVTKTLQAAGSGTINSGTPTWASAYNTGYKTVGVDSPAAYSLSSSGLITASPTATGSTTLAAVMVDPYDQAYANVSFTAYAYAPMAFSTQPSSVTAITGSAYTGSRPALSNLLATSATYALMSGGSDVTAAFNASSGATCPGLKVATATGVISGTPTDTCSVPGLTLVATDGYDGSTATSSAFSVSVTQSSISVTGMTPKVRSGSGFTATATTSLSGPTWSSASSPSSPAMTATVSGTALSGTAPTVTAQTTYNLTMTAKQGTTYTLNAPPVSTLVYPRLTASLAAVSQNAGTTLNVAPTVNASAAQVGTLTYALTAGGVTDPNALSSCGIAFSASTGALTSSALRQCSFTGATVKVTDDGGGTSVLTDAATATFNVTVGAGYAFSPQPSSFVVEPGRSGSTTVTVTGSPAGSMSWTLADASGDATTVPSWISTSGCTNSGCTVTAQPPSGTSGTYPANGSTYRLTARDGNGSAVVSNGFTVGSYTSAQNLTPVAGSVPSVSDFWVNNSARRTGTPTTASWGNTANLASCPYGGQAYVWDFGQPVAANSAAFDVYANGGGSIPVYIRYSSDGKTWTTVYSLASLNYASNYQWISSSANWGSVAARYWAFSGGCSQASALLSSFRLSN